MFSSALRKQLGTCAVALTNRIGNFDFLRPRLSAFEEVVYDLWGGPATYMFDRTRAYVRFLSEESHRDSPRHLVFADTDVLFTRSFKEVFDTPFDVGLTFRNMAKYPINNGIMFAHRQRLTEAAKFWEGIVSIFESEGFDKRWQGDQYAVCKFMEQAGNYYTGRRTLVKDVQGVRVKLLHASIFNLPPRSGCKIGPQVKVIHFKGGEKSKLPQAWRILQRAQGGKALDDIAWIGASRTQRLRGALKSCKDS
mmetsp:Transcript_2461/g.5846  ORF Transcript_2461/g.5846 Transcript_2461/m.5846 type:complete len:251 (-) Transcript_2461:75-827(-)